MRINGDITSYREQLLVFGDHMIFKMECHIYVTLSIMKGLGGHVTLEEHISDRVLKPSVSTTLMGKR